MKPRPQCKGLKKIEGKELHELKYEIAKGGKGLLIGQYFDPETFRHVRSQYGLSVALLHGNNRNYVEWLSGGNRDVRSLVEMFDNFKEVDGLTLLHSYKIISEMTGFPAEWNLSATQVMHNRQLDPKLFVVR